MKFEAYATRREPMDGLYVQEDTLGRHHSIDMPEGTVVITLPTLTETHRIGGRDGIAPGPDNPETTWLWFEVISVDIRVDLRKPVHFEGSEADFNGPKVSRSASAKRSFEAVLEATDGALDIWKRTLRWIALSPGIAFSDLSTGRDATQIPGYEIFRKSDDARFYGHGGSKHQAGPSR